MHSLNHSMSYQHAWLVHVTIGCTCLYPIYNPVKNFCIDVKQCDWMDVHIFIRLKNYFLLGQMLLHLSKNQILLCVSHAF